MDADTPEARLSKARRWAAAEPFRRITVPKLYRSARMADFAGVKLVKPNADGLYITGAAGVGKTHLATAWLAEMAPRLVRLGEGYEDLAYDEAFWTSVPELLCELRATFNGEGSEAEVLRKYSGAALLVLDDLGAQKVSDWTVESLYLLVSRRVNNCLPTIVTSNLKLKELDQIDSRLASRLGGMAYQDMPGGDRRLGAPRE